MMTIVEKLYDLQKQATTEKSHYYVASVTKEAIAEIERLESELVATQRLLRRRQYGV
jgi:hypothetical protein